MRPVSQPPHPGHPGHRDLQRRASGIGLHITSLPGVHAIGGLGDEAHRFVDWLASAG